MSVIDEYLSTVPPAQSSQLERVRQIIKQQAPNAAEVITYGMPGFKVNGKYLISFGNFKDHMSIFPGADPTHTVKEKLQGYKTSKGTIQFTVDKPLPESLIKEIVQLCLDRTAA